MATNAKPRPRDVRVNVSAMTPVVVHLDEADRNHLEQRVGELRDRHDYGMGTSGAPIPTRAAILRLAVRELMQRTNEEIEALLFKWRQLP